MAWTYRADNLIYLYAPINDVTKLPMADDSTVTALLYDTALDTKVAKRIVRLTADAEALTDTLAVDSTIGIEDGDTLEIPLNDGSISDETVDSTTALTIVLVGTLDSAAKKGGEVRKIVTSATGVILTVGKARGWAKGDTADYEQDDLALVSETVSAVNEKLGLITLPAGPTAVVSVGRRVRQRVGAQITSFSSFGTFPTTVATTDPASELWGFVATVDKDHAGTYFQQRVAYQVIATDGATDLRQEKTEIFE